MKITKIIAKNNLSKMRKKIMGQIILYNIRIKKRH